MGHDDTTKFGNTTIRWGAGVASDKRAEVLAKMQAIRPSKARRVKISHDNARAAAEERGERALAQPDATEPSQRANTVVRVYYRSMGDELLAFDAGPMRRCDAYRLTSSIPEAVDWDVFQGTQERHLRSGARLVVLPSQRTESAEVESASEVGGSEVREMSELLVASGHDARHAADLNADGIGPHELETRLAVPSGEVGSLEFTHGIRKPIRRSYYADAMARRAARMAA
jgi:hypothetical protein